MLGGEAGQRDREIEPHPHLAATVVGEAIELLVGFVASLAGEDLEVFKRRGVDRHKAVGAVNAPRDVEDPLPSEGLRGEMIAETLERAGLDEGAGFDGRARVGHGAGPGEERRKASVIPPRATGTHHPRAALALRSGGRQPAGATIRPALTTPPCMTAMKRLRSWRTRMSVVGSPSTRRTSASLPG